MAKKVNRKSWVIQRLRRTSMRWPPRNEAKNEGRREYYKTRKDGTKFSRPNFEYQCQKCLNWFMDKDIQMDHVNPVVSLDQEFKTEAEWIGNFVISLLCDKENYQRLCKDCHTIKSQNENKIRKEIKNKRKKKYEKNKPR